jgi:hypothetical protein
MQLIEQPKISVQSATSALGKKPWATPAITKIDLKSACGAHSGPLCDRYGSMSHGPMCGT